MGADHIRRVGLAEEELQPKDEHLPLLGEGSAAARPRMAFFMHNIIGRPELGSLTLADIISRLYPPRLIRGPGPAENVTSDSAASSSRGRQGFLIIDRARAVARVVLLCLALVVLARLFLGVLFFLDVNDINLQSPTHPVLYNPNDTTTTTAAARWTTTLAMAQLTHLLALLGLLTPLIQSAAAAITLPLHSSSRWILDAANQRVKFRCVNWAGHMETNIPEGLNHQPLDAIAAWIAAQGFNCVRLTYSTDHALNPSLRVADSFAAAASAAGVSAQQMTDLYNAVVAKNPWIGPATTTRDVFAAVVDRLWTGHGIMTLLDNHVSKASWCCNLTDGNGWWDEGFGYNTWNSRYFNTNNWIAGLRAMAEWSRGHKGVVAMSLRNEIREFLLQGLNNRDDWYKFVKAGGDAVHAANGDLLIVVGGTQSSTDLVHLRANDGARGLDTSGAGGWADKRVWEMHAYSFTVTYPDPFKNCDLVQAQYGLFAGFVLEQGKPWTGPLILSEFGVGMRNGGLENGLNEQDDRYLKCLVSYMQNNDADWAVWALQGSYYVRDKAVDYDEGWGLLNHDWSGWRNDKFKDMLGDMWKMTQQP